jgi:hypothetical protein
MGSLSYLKNPFDPARLRLFLIKTHTIDTAYDLALFSFVDARSIAFAARLDLPSMDSNVNTHYPGMQLPTSRVA